MIVYQSLTKTLAIEAWSFPGAWTLPRKLSELEICHLPFSTFMTAVSPPCRFNRMSDSVFRVKTHLDFRQSMPAYASYPPSLFFSAAQSRFIIQREFPD
jgi:hypothetical protein